MARERGFTIDEPAAKAALVKSLTHTPNLSSIDHIVQATSIIDPAASEASALIAAHSAGLKPSLTTAIQARYVASAQRADGHWLTFDARPPQGHSEFTTTALTIRMLQMYMPEELREETAARTERARAWLVKATPATTEDATFRLRGLVWANAADAERAPAVSDLRKLQRANGGWAQIPGREPDAYATGEVLVALHDSGVPVTDPAWRKGLQFLLSSQNADGSWHVATRMVSPAQVSPPYFESGFPFGHDQFISSAGTAYATMAILAVVPKAAHGSVPLPMPELAPKGEKPWMRTALFGTVAELKALLDKGLDVNSHSDEGTTLLMFAAPDPARVKLLIDRGANVKATAKTGFDALLVTSLYRGSADALRMLLAKGASPAPRTGVLFSASPLVLSVYAGDAANIALLHSKGADVNRKMMLLGIFPTSPLFAAAAFGEVEVMRALIVAGADLKEQDPTGLSLLHQAALANHLDAAQLLIASGAPVDTVDKNGYSALLYASTINFGDDRMVKLLLKAGANPAIKAKSGETALSQAKRYHHTNLVAALGQVSSK
jgi:ankyrin repeat protein